MYGKEYLEEKEIQEIVNTLDARLLDVKKDSDSQMFHEAWRRFMKKHEPVMESLRNSAPGQFISVPANIPFYDAQRNMLERQRNRDLSGLFGGILG